MAVSSAQAGTGSALAIPSIGSRPSQGVTRRALRRLLRQSGGRLGLLILGALVVVAVLAPRPAPHYPLKIPPRPPPAPPPAGRLFGADDLGRDVLCRGLFGGRSS